MAQKVVWEIFSFESNHLSLICLIQTGSNRHKWGWTLCVPKWCWYTKKDQSPQNRFKPSWSKSAEIADIVKVSIHDILQKYLRMWKLSSKTVPYDDWKRLLELLKRNLRGFSCDLWQLMKHGSATTLRTPTYYVALLLSLKEEIAKGRNREKTEQMKKKCSFAKTMHHVYCFDVKTASVAFRFASAFTVFCRFGRPLVTITFSQTSKKRVAGKKYGSNEQVIAETEDFEGMDKSFYKKDI